MRVVVENARGADMRAGWRHPQNAELGPDQVVLDGHSLQWGSAEVTLGLPGQLGSGFVPRYWPMRRAGRGPGRGMPPGGSAGSRWLWRWSDRWRWARQA